MRRPARTLLAVLSLLAVAGVASGCGTVDLGDNISPPDIQVNEDYFFCVVQPQVIATNRCASGGPGEGGMCHSARSAMRLQVAAETDAPPACDAMNHATGMVPDSYRQNLDAIRPEVQNSIDDSPIYRRPTALDSHPRMIFGTVAATPPDPNATIIQTWLAMGAT